jgi:CHAD domain-containing protein
LRSSVIRGGHRIVETDRSDKPGFRDFLAYRASEAVGVFLSQLVAVRERSNRKTVHALSTSLRRLTSADWLVREISGSKWIRRRKFGLYDLSKSVGALRDTQEMARCFSSLRLRNACAREFRKYIKAEIESRSKELESTVSSFESEDFESLGKESSIHALFGSESTNGLPVYLGRLRAGLLDFRKSALSGNDNALHRLRLCLKKYRYSHALIAPEWSDLSPGDLDVLKTLQDELP